MYKITQSQLNIGLAIFAGFVMFSFWPGETMKSARASIFDIPIYNIHTRTYNYEDPLKQSSHPDTQYTPKQSLKITNWFSKTKEKIASKFKKTTPPTKSNAVDCNSSSISWTVPDGTQSIQVSIYNVDGSFQKSYTITNYIAINPKQRLVVKAEC